MDDSAMRFDELARRHDGDGTIGTNTDQIAVPRNNDSCPRCDGTLQNPIICRIAEDNPYPFPRENLRPSRP